MGVHVRGHVWREKGGRKHGTRDNTSYRQSTDEGTSRVYFAWTFLCSFIHSSKALVRFQLVLQIKDSHSITVRRALESKGTKGTEHMAALFFPQPHKWVWPAYISRWIVLFFLHEKPLSAFEAQDQACKPFQAITATLKDGRKNA